MKTQVAEATCSCPKKLDMFDSEPTQEIGQMTEIVMHIYVVYNELNIVNKWAMVRI